MSTALQQKFPIGECLYVRWNYPDRTGVWWEPFFVEKMTPAFVYVREFMGRAYRLRRRSLELSGFTIHRSTSTVFRTELPAEYLKQTIGYLLHKAPREILGLKDEWSEDELKRAYRAAATKAHPDAGGSHEQFILVQAAYERLKKPASLGDMLNFVAQQDKP